MKPAASSVSRRELGLALVAASAAVAVAQQPAAPEDLLGAERDRVKRSSETLRNFRIPIATEPSFSFRP